MGQDRRIVLVAAGTLGDVLPFATLARALASEGFEPIVATYPCHLGHVEKASVAAFPLGPDLPDILADIGIEPDGFVEQMTIDPAFFPKHVVLPHLRAQVEALGEIVEGALMVIAHVAAPAAGIAAEMHRVPFATVLLSPFLAPSAFDPPLIPALPFVSTPKSAFAIGWNKAVRAAFRLALARLSGPVDRLRHELGLADATQSFSVFRSRTGGPKVLGLFSPLFSSRQPDHPPEFEIVGAVAHEQNGAAKLAANVEDFLEAGDPPVVVTMGSLSSIPDGFYETCVAAARRSGRRTLLLMRDGEAARLGSLAAFDVHVAGYVPHPLVMGRACLIVHHGGMGTATEALRAGVPQIVVPSCNDQFDNAARLERLGVSRTFSRRSFDAGTAAEAIQALCADSMTLQRASAVADIVRREDGAAAAARWIAREIGLLIAPRGDDKAEA